MKLILVLLSTVISLLRIARSPCCKFRRSEVQASDVAIVYFTGFQDFKIASYLAMPLAACASNKAGHTLRQCASVTFGVCC
jgi:hypothetical protein